MRDLRQDYRAIATLHGDQRTAEQLIEHVLKTRLADELRHSVKEDRTETYSRVSSQLFASLSHHPAHKKRDCNAQYVSNRQRLLSDLIPRNGVFVEIGAGDGRLASAMCRNCAKSVAVDVTASVLDRSALPSNFEFVLTDGIRLDIASGSADLVYSHQVMEHIHPDDVEEQLAEIHRILKPGGIYFCVTPSRISGPHDVSRYFDNRARGLHLHEYTYAELGMAFRRSGFAEAQPLFLIKGQQFKPGLSVAVMIEKAVAFVDYVFGRRLRRRPKITSLLGVNMLAIKGKVGLLPMDEPSEPRFTGG